MGWGIIHKNSVHLNMFKKVAFLLILFSDLASVGQERGWFHLDNLPTEFIDRWKYHDGDNMVWGDTTFDDKDWVILQSNFNYKKLPLGVHFSGIGWFRIHLRVVDSLQERNLGLLLTQNGASELYLDGKFLYRFGNLGKGEQALVKHYDPKCLPVDIRFSGTGVHLLAVRYVYENLDRCREADDFTPGFQIRFSKLREAIEDKYVNSNIITACFVFYYGFFLALGFLHLMMFLFYRKERSNLYYAIFNIFFGMIFVWLAIVQNMLFPDFDFQVQNLAGYLPNIYGPALLAMLYTIFFKKLNRIFWIMFSIFAIDFFLSLFNWPQDWLSIGTLLIILVDGLRVIILAIARKKDGAWIVGGGVITTLVFFGIYTVGAMTSGTYNFKEDGLIGIIMVFLIIIATLSTPISMTIYLARDFAKKSVNLEKKLIEVEELSSLTVRQEKEKREMLSNQNVVLERQVKERTSEISEQKKLIEEKNKDITDSILYAKRLQEAILPSREEIAGVLADFFLLYSPKDIVAGDFYWLFKDDENIFIAAADCTGHGVPGALVSVVCSNALNRSVKEFKLTETGEILNKARELVCETFDRSEGSVNDGMDISLLRIPRNREMGGGLLEIQWSGANNPLWYIENGKCEEIKGDKQPVGRYNYALPFNTHNLRVSQGARFYIFSDGYADQFGVNEKKLLKRKLREYLMEIHLLSFGEQMKKLEEYHRNWKGEMEQTDDILIMGIGCGGGRGN